jgi:hypothetical protein
MDVLQSQLIVMALETLCVIQLIPNLKKKYLMRVSVRKSTYLLVLLTKQPK